MTRLLFVDQEASEEAEAQVRYYTERAGTHVALRFIAEVEAVYRGLAESRLVGVRSTCSDPARYPVRPSRGGTRGFRFHHAGRSVSSSTRASGSASR